MIGYKNLFSASTSSHEDLWKTASFVWDALKHIHDYIENFTHHIDIEIPEGVYIKDKEHVTIGSNTTIEPGAYIEESCIIGKNCSIKHGAYIRKNSIIGDNCTVGHCCELKHCILFDHAVVAHLCYVGDSILGSHVNLAAGVKCANLRLDRKEIKIHSEGEKYLTGLQKFGSIIGDHCQVGCNVVLNPGTIIGTHCSLLPLVNVGGVIPSFSFVKQVQSFHVEAKSFEYLLSQSR